MVKRSSPENEQLVLVKLFGSNCSKERDNSVKIMSAFIFFSGFGSQNR